MQVYARTPYAFGFQEIVDELGLYHGPVKTPEELVKDITQDSGEGSIDLVVLGTCEVEYVSCQSHIDGSLLIKDVLACEEIGMNNCWPHGMHVMAIISFNSSALCIMS